MRTLLGGLLLGLASLACHAEARTYLLACGAPGESAPPSGARLLASLREASAIRFGPGDVLLVARGSVCVGSLSLEGAGTEAQPVVVRAFGRGPLPRIRAEPGAEQAVTLRNGSHWQITELDIEGGTRRGLFVTATKGAMEDVLLRDLHVHDAYGPLRRKEDGLVVVTASQGAALHHIVLDDVRAERTTLWSGIFVAGDDGGLRSSNVLVKNSTAHDVQGDGIVLFSLDDGTLENNAAWHTGMQHSYSLGTPNGIWTWHCHRCTVEQSEAFLTDSPGVDGGSFDIDFGNVDNRVVHNFGHDTQGYCVSVFGAFGPTVNSEIAHNTCIRNGRSPRLAERQGAILLMTWSEGRIEQASIHDNLVLWAPDGNTPAIQIGEGLQASMVRLEDNHILTSAVPPVALEAKRFLRDLSPSPLPRADKGEPDTAAWEQTSRQHAYPPRPVRLALVIGSDADGERVRSLLQRVFTLASQFSSEQLAVTVSVPACSTTVRSLVADWAAEASKPVEITAERCSAHLSSHWQIGIGKERRNLPEDADRAVVWRSVAAQAGLPDFSSLPFVPVPAHD